MTALEEIARFADVPVNIDVEIDRPPLKLGGVLSIKEGSVLQLARSAGENVDIRVGGVLIGWGEIIVSENVVGVRIIDFRSVE